MAVAAGVGFGVGWIGAQLYHDSRNLSASPDLATGILEAAKEGLEASARTLAEIEKPPGSHDPEGGWRLPIVRGLEVQWIDLSPWYQPELPVDSPQLRGCISGPGISVAECDELVVSRDGLIFPRRGPWILDTSYGAVKVLPLDRVPDPRRTVVYIATFVASNVAHSTADTRRFNPWRIDQIPALNVPRLFWSDQPVKDWCGGVAALVACVFENEGFATRKVEIGRLEDDHIVTEVGVGDDDWIVVDVDWGHLFTDRRGCTSTSTRFAIG